MKKLIIILSFTLSCFFVVCSCKKTPSPQDLLVGTWQLTKSEITHDVGGNSANNTVIPETDTFIVFENNGRGRFFTINRNRNFTYVFNDPINNLIMTYDNGGESSTIVEVLTENSLILYYTSKATIYGITLSSTGKEYYTKVE